MCIRDSHIAVRLNNGILHQDAVLDNSALLDLAAADRYMESLRIYKQERTHYITYGSFENGTEQSKNEGAYLRSVYSFKRTSFAFLL